MRSRFANRHAAGQALAAALRSHEFDRPVVYGLPRGGVPVAFEVAKGIKAPLDIVVVRKMGVPGHEELSMGAIGHGGIIVRNESIIRHLGIDQGTLDQIAAVEARNVARLERELRGDRDRIEAADRDVVLVDDGLATGATMAAAVAIVGQEQPRTITAAIPVGPPEVCDRLRANVDDVIALLTPEHFVAVGFWYRDFDQTSTDEVVQLLSDARHFGSGLAGET